MMSRTALTLATLLLSLTCCPARLQESQEAVTAGAIAAWTRMCEEVTGQLPTTWPEYREALKFSLNDILDTTLPTRRYGVMTPTVPLIPPLNGTMLVVTRRPIEDTKVPHGFLSLTDVLKGPGRYVIYKDAADAQIKYQWVSEDYVVKTFNAANLPLPDQDDEPERPWVTQARQTMHWRRVELGVVLAGVIAAMAYVGLRMRVRVA